MTLNNLIGIDLLDQPTIELILSNATQFLQEYIKTGKQSQQCQGMLVANLFFEPSTRTCNSFEIAAKRLGAMTLTPNMQSSSLQKGETLLDTFKSIQAMGVNAFVVRHQRNGIMQWLSKHLASEIQLINAGEGWLAHPSQALLDLLTISQYKSSWASLSVAVLGDLRHSRVARSFVHALRIMGVKDIRLIAPKELQPESDIADQATAYYDVTAGLKDADVVMCLRLQKERMQNDQLVDEALFHSQFGLSKERLALAKPDAIVMHPGPIQRGVEIASDVADGQQSVILNQVTNGVAVRMAILQHLLLNTA